MNNDNVFYANLDRTTDESVNENMKPNFLLKIIVRLPSILLADLILLHSEFLVDQIHEKFEGYLNIILASLISKFFLLLSIFICLQIFTLKLSYAINIYKVMGLISIPFIFRSSIQYTREHEFSLYFFQVPPVVIVCLIYSILFTFTTLLYNEIYSNIIADKKRIHERYKIEHDQSDEAINEYLDSLLDQDASANMLEVDLSIEGQNSVQDEIKSATTKRRIFILFYFMLSLVINEITYFSAPKDYYTSENKHEDFNIVSLGYLTLLFYDLILNMDQLILRFLIKAKYLGNLISEFGFNNILSYNWFYRLRVPFMLRLYFVFKCIVFTLQFVIYYNYYFQLNTDTEFLNINKQNTSLVSYLRSFFQEEDSSFAVRSNTRLNSNASNITDSPIKLNEALMLVLNFNYIDIFNLENFTIEFAIEVFSLYIKMLTLNLSNTILSIGAITSVLALKFNFLGRIVSKITSDDNSRNNDQQNRDQAVDPDDILNVGDVAAIFFFILSIQTGLSSLSGQQRIDRFLKNYSLLFIAILHYFHTNYDTQLIQLSASSRPNWKSKKHLRLLSVCLSLIIIPMIILYSLWKNFVISTWFLAAVAFNIELIIKMSVTIIQYVLFIRESQKIALSYDSDSGQADELSDNLDDYIYYVKGFGHITEFLIALFLFFNGIYILLFESYGGIRAVMVCIHAYFHIFVQAKKGWSTYMKRRTAIKKIKRLEIFNRESFRQMNSINRSEQEFSEADSDNDEYSRKLKDPCAICFSEIGAHESRITNCKHFFHSICLRKWLYIQDKCPMCQSIMYPSGD